MHFAHLLIFLALAATPLFSQIELGGKVVPKDSCIVYIFIGHSNMSGRGIHRDTVPHPKLWNYTLDQTTFGRPNHWRLAKEAMYVDASIGQDTKCGPGMIFMKQFNKRYPDFTCCLFLNGEGHTSAAVYLNNQVQSGRKLYDEIMTPLKTVVKGKVVFGGMLAFLGIVEPYDGDEAACRNFANTMRSLVNLVRYELNAPTMPFVINQYEATAIGGFSPNLPLPKIIQSQIDSLPSILSNCIVIPTTGIPLYVNEYGVSDDHHYDSIGYAEFTRRMLDSLEARKFTTDYWKNPLSREWAGLTVSSSGVAVSPNPFSATTLLSWPVSGASSMVRIFSSNGQLVQELEGAPHGRERFAFWNGNGTAGTILPAGPYFIQTRSPKGEVTSKKVIKIK